MEKFRVLTFLELKLLPPIRQDGDKSCNLYAVPNKQTKPDWIAET